MAPRDSDSNCCFSQVAIPIPWTWRGSKGGEGGRQRCSTLWLGSSFYPNCIHNWQLRCKWYLLISQCRKPQEHAMREIRPVGWETHPTEFSYWHNSPATNSELLLLNQITCDSLPFVKNSTSLTMLLSILYLLSTWFPKHIREYYSIGYHKIPVDFFQVCISISINFLNFRNFKKLMLKFKRFA